jgi:dUTP pyrophosphatase
MTAPNFAPHGAVDVDIKRLYHAADLYLPAYATAESAGMDLLAAVDAPVSLAPGERRLIPTGIAIALQPGSEAQVRPRSGLALKHGITVLNAPGTIDADYRGEVGVVLINHGDQPFVIERGSRIAQMVVTAYARVAWTVSADLEASARGAGGFGSTGFHSDKASAAGS